MMNYSQFLLDLARRNAANYAAQPGLQAIMLTGSAAQGQSDRYSDIDMILYYDEVPTEAEITALREANGGADGDWYGPAEDDGRSEYYHVQNVRCDVAHMTVVANERVIADLLEEFDTDPIKQKIASGILNGQILYGGELIQGWQARLAAYPTELAERIVRQNLRFYRPWIMRGMVAERGDLVFLHQIFSNAVRSVLAILCALNRVYNPLEFKRQNTFLPTLKIAPAELTVRLTQLYHLEPVAAAGEMAALIRETLDLAARHLSLPEIETARQRFALPYREWANQIETDAPDAN